jgi:hypothetical protein
MSFVQPGTISVMLKDRKVDRHFSRIAIIRCTATKFVYNLALSCVLQDYLIM